MMLDTFAIIYGYTTSLICAYSIMMTVIFSNIYRESIEKSSKIGQEKKILISASVCFLTAITIV